MGQLFPPFSSHSFVRYTQCHFTRHTVLQVTEPFWLCAAWRSSVTCATQCVAMGVHTPLCAPFPISQHTRPHYPRFLLLHVSMEPSTPLFRALYKLHVCHSETYPCTPVHGFLTYLNRHRKHTFQIQCTRWLWYLLELNKNNRNCHFVCASVIHLRYAKSEPKSVPPSTSQNG